MEQTLLGRILFGKELNQLIGQYNELISGLALLKLKCPKVWWALEGTILASDYHSKYCIPMWKQLTPAYEQYKREKEELIKLREEVAKLKSAKKKTTTKSKKSKSRK